ncbi:hypothetical protein ACNF49_30580 [Actinomadura sp. ATCC 39365]
MQPWPVDDELLDLVKALYPANCKGSEARLIADPRLPGEFPGLSRQEDKRADHSESPNDLDYQFHVVHPLQWPQSAFGTTQPLKVAMSAW